MRPGDYVIGKTGVMFLILLLVYDYPATDKHPAFTLQMRVILRMEAEAAKDYD